MEGILLPVESLERMKVVNSKSDCMFSESEELISAHGEGICFRISLIAHWTALASQEDVFILCYLLNLTNVFGEWMVFVQV